MSVIPQYGISFKLSTLSGCRYSSNQGAKLKKNKGIPNRALVLVSCFIEVAYICTVINPKKRVQSDQCLGFSALRVQGRKRCQVRVRDRG